MGLGDSSTKAWTEIDSVTFLLLHPLASGRFLGSPDRLWWFFFNVTVDQEKIFSKIRRSPFSWTPSFWFRLFVKVTWALLYMEGESQSTSAIMSLFVNDLRWISTYVMAATSQRRAKLKRSHHRSPPPSNWSQKLNLLTMEMVGPAGEHEVLQGGQVWPYFFLYLALQSAMLWLPKVPMQHLSTSPARNSLRTCVTSWSRPTTAAWGTRRWEKRWTLSAPQGWGPRPQGAPPLWPMSPLEQYCRRCYVLNIQVVIKLISYTLGIKCHCSHELSFCLTQSGLPQQVPHV